MYAVDESIVLTRRVQPHSVGCTRAQALPTARACRDRRADDAAGDRARAPPAPQEAL